MKNLKILQRVEKVLFNNIISLDEKNINLEFNKTKNKLVENINTLISETKEDQLVTRLVETKILF